jgi:hypothetical protein
VNKTDEEDGVKLPGQEPVGPQARGAGAELAASAILGSCIRTAAYETPTTTQHQSIRISMVTGVSFINDGAR